MIDDRWRDTYDAWKTRNPEDGFLGPESDNEEESLAVQSILYMDEDEEWFACNTAELES